MVLWHRGMCRFGLMIVLCVKGYRLLIYICIEGNFVCVTIGACMCMQYICEFRRWFLQLFCVNPRQCALVCLFFILPKDDDLKTESCIDILGIGQCNKRRLIIAKPNSVIVAFHMFLQAGK